MSDETPDIETPSDSEDAPKKRRVLRRSKASASEGTSAPEAGSRASDADATSEAAVADDESAAVADDESAAVAADESAAVADDESAAVAAASEDVDTQAEEKPEPEAEAEAPLMPKRGRRSKPEAEKPAPPKRAPAPSRRRAAREPGAPIPVVRAQAKYVRSSPRKARLVCDHIRGKTVEEARAILAHTPRAVARDWSKLLESAVANAEHNHELVGEDLYVKSVHADDGPTIKRFRPRAMGRATKIRKRTSHLTILLTPKE
jgi:ribosomal protein L22